MVLHRTPWHQPRSRRQAAVHCPRVKQEDHPCVIVIVLACQRGLDRHSNLVLDLMDQAAVLRARLVDHRRLRVCAAWERPHALLHAVQRCNRLSLEPGPVAVFSALITRAAPLSQLAQKPVEQEEVLRIFETLGEKLPADAVH